MIRRPPRSTLSSSSAASDVYKRQLWHSAPNRPFQTGTDGLVFTTTAPLVSVGTGVGVGAWRSASTPVDTSGPGMARFVPHAVSGLVNGGYGPPAFSSEVPNASGRAIPVAGFLDPGGAPQGVAGLARGTRPVIGSGVWWCASSRWARRRNWHGQWWSTPKSVNETGGL